MIGARNEGSSGVVGAPSLSLGSQGRLLGVGDNYVDQEGGESLQMVGPIGAAVASGNASGEQGSF